MRAYGTRGLWENCAESNFRWEQVPRRLVQVPMLAGARCKLKALLGSSFFMCGQLHVSIISEKTDQTAGRSSEVDTRIRSWSPARESGLQRETAIA